MPLNTVQRTAVVDYIVTNGSQAWKASDALREALENMDEEPLLAIEDQVNISLVAGEFANITRNTLNIPDDAEMGEELEHLPGLITNAVKNVKDLFKKKDPEEEEEEDDVTANAQTWLDKAPPAIQSVVNRALARDEKDRQTLVTKLTTNCSPSKKTAIANKTLEELEELDEIIGNHKPAPQSGLRPSTGFFSRGTPTEVTSGFAANAGKIEPLMPVEIDWANS